MVFNAQNGWEVGSEIQARYSRELSKPLIGVINQLDAEKGRPRRGCRRSRPIPDSR